MTKLLSETLLRQTEIFLHPVEMYVLHHSYMRDTTAGDYSEECERQLMGNVLCSPLSVLAYDVYYNSTTI